MKINNTQIFCFELNNAIQEPILNIVLFLIYTPQNTAYTRIFA